MRVNYCSHVALLVSLALVNVGCTMLPLECGRRAPILHRRSEDSVYDDIVRDSKPLQKLKKDLVMFAYSSEFENSNFYWDKYYDARDAFWDYLRKKEKGDDEYDGVMMIICEGDENQVRKLFADGTIFCKDSNGNYGSPLKSITWNPKGRTQEETMWKKMIDDKKQNVEDVMNALAKRKLHKQRVSNPKEFLSPTHNDTVTNECYDVSFRDGQDVMLKWAIADRKKDQTDKVLKKYHKKKGRFNNLIMGSLYLAYLMEFDDKMEAISDKLNCTEVNDNMRDSCNTLYNYATKQSATGELSRTKTDIPDYFYTSKPSDDKGEVKKSFYSYDRNQINPTEFLEVY
ncbi:hypothetical protein IWQ62_001783 [Dispira parvispora]|uniref:Uncharacterized protein n=1 Tax=Dispira parvispora TaxID=1520584 RepID=A0A9W8AX63_9FUNG|nr:hypothetical protein IWQ62_001783 [Dispira parvispora]